MEAEVGDVDVVVEAREAVVGEVVGVAAEAVMVAVEIIMTSQETAQVVKPPEDEAMHGISKTNWPAAEIAKNKLQPSEMDNQS